MVRKLVAVVFTLAFIYTLSFSDYAWANGNNDVCVQNAKTTSIIFVTVPDKVVYVGE